MQPTMQIDLQELRRLHNTIQEIADSTRKGIGKIVVKSGYWAAQSAAKATKQSPKNRKVYKVAKSHIKNGAAPDWAMFRIEAVSTKTGNPYALFARSRSKATRMKRIPNRGAAKAGWYGAMRKLGTKSGTRVTGTSTLRTLEGGGLRASAADQSNAWALRKSGSIIGVRLDNTIRYIAKTSPNAATVGVQMTEKRLRGEWLRAEDKRIQRLANRK